MWQLCHGKQVVLIYMEDAAVLSPWVNPDPPGSGPQPSRLLCISFRRQVRAA